jgi:hypothetical protein
MVWIKTRRDLIKAVEEAASGERPSHPAMAFQMAILEKFNDV